MVGPRGNVWRQIGNMDHSIVGFRNKTVSFSGKTLLLKAKAKADSLVETQQVYYISLGAVDYLHSPFNNVHAIPSVFDVATQKQFANTSVEFLSAVALRDKYITEEQGSANTTQSSPSAPVLNVEQTNVYTLLQWLITKQPDASFLGGVQGYLRSGAPAYF